MKKLLGIGLAVVGLAAIGVGVAKAGDKYHVYKYNGHCEVDQRSHSQYDSARGSGWSCLGEYDYASDAGNEKDRQVAAGNCD